MIDALQEIETKAKRAIEACTSEDALRDIEVAYLGRKGELTNVLKGLKDVAPEERTVIGGKANAVKSTLEVAMSAKLATLKDARYARIKETEWVDPTAVLTNIERGYSHPLNDFIEDAKRVFGRLGFSVAVGPEIDDDFHSFVALNFPPDHPARDSQDTLFIQDGGGLMMRSQTSSVQIRELEKGNLPLKIIVPGRVFRRDDFDASHSPMFHQLEGLYIDRNVSIGNLKAVLSEALRELIDKKAEFRFRSRFFPFVEPGLEVDMTCTVCGGKGCSVCKHTGWVEVLGAGMVHPNVLRNSGVNPDEWNGFAFGMGLDRLVMLRHRINDIRLLYENDMRFLRQF